MIAQMTHAVKCSSGIRAFTACDPTASHTRVRVHHATPLSPVLSLKAVGSWLGRRDTLVAPPECLFPASSAKRRLSQLPCSFLASRHPRACVWACHYILVMYTCSASMNGTDARVSSVRMRCAHTHVREHTRAFSLSTPSLYGALYTGAQT